MTKVCLRREGDTLVPVDDDSLAVVRGFKDGAEVLGVLRGARNLEQLRLFWLLVGIVSKSSDIAKETLKRDLAFRLGFTDTWVDHDGTIHIDPQSIAVESMTQAVFDEFFRLAVETMAGWIGAEHKDLMRQFNEAAADKRYLGMEHR